MNFKSDFERDTIKDFESGTKLGYVLGTIMLIGLLAMLVIGFWPKDESKSFINEWPRQFPDDRIFCTNCGNLCKLTVESAKQYYHKTGELLYYQRVKCPNKTWHNNCMDRPKMLTWQGATMTYTKAELIKMGALREENEK